MLGVDHFHRHTIDATLPSNLGWVFPEVCLAIANASATPPSSPGTAARAGDWRQTMASA